MLKKASELRLSKIQDGLQSIKFHQLDCLSIAVPIQHFAQLDVQQT